MAQATDAFVDRAPIDWHSLLTRARTHGARARIENLRLLDVLRRAAAPSARPPETAARSVLLCAVVALAALHTAGSLLLVAVAVATGASIVLLPTQIVLAVTFSAASITLGASASHDARRLYLLGTFACAASAFARAATSGLPEQTFSLAGALGLALHLLQGLRLEVFTPACLWQFALDFPRVRRFTRFDVLARRTTTALWLLGLAGFCLGLGVAAGALDESRLVQLLPNHKSNAFWRIFTVAIVLAVGAIFMRARRAPPGERRKVARFALALAAGTAPFLALGVARTIVPALDRWLLTAHAVERFWLDVLIVGGLTAVPILTTAAVLADRPLELQAIVRRTWRRALVTIGLAMVVGVPFVVVAAIVYGRRNEPIGDLLSRPEGSLALVCVVMGGLLLLARSRVRGVIERRGHRIRAGDHDQLAQAIARLHMARGAREVGHIVSETLAASIGATNVRLLGAAGPDGFRDPWETTRLPAEARLVALVRGAEEPLDLSSEAPLTSLLSSHERHWLVVNQVELAAPVTRRDGSLAAIVVCGARRGHRPFDRRDLSIVQALAVAASAVWSSDPSECAFECPQCGQVGESLAVGCACRARPVLAPLPRHLDSTYLVLQRLGAGSMGVVYRAQDSRSGRDVALKTLPELAPSSVAQLRAESRVLAGLTHDCIATFHDLVLWRDTPVVVMEYFAAGTLARQIRNHPLSCAAALDLGVQLAGALTYVHDRQLLHRDLKPSNVALTLTGAPKLLDFGLAELVEPAPAAHPRVRLAGTFAYLPPEAFCGAPPSPALDLWALAVVLFEALTGANPFASYSRRVALQRILKIEPAALCHPFSEKMSRFSTFFDRALARAPEQRFQTAHEMREAFEALRG